MYSLIGKWDFFLAFVNNICLKYSDAVHVDLNVEHKQNTKSEIFNILAKYSTFIGSENQFWKNKQWKYESRIKTSFLINKVSKCTQRIA